MNGGRLIHGQNAERLEATAAALDQRNNAGAFKNSLVTVAAQAGHMKQHILHAVVWHNKTKPLGNIKPFHNAGDLGQFNRIARKVFEI